MILGFFLSCQDVLGDLFQVVDLPSAELTADEFQKIFAFFILFYDAVSVKI